MQTITPPTADAPSIRRKQSQVLTVLTVLALAVAGGVWWFGLRDSGSDITPVTVEGTSTCTETSDGALRSSGICTDTMSDPRCAFGYSDRDGVDRYRATDGHGRNLRTHQRQRHLGRRLVR